MPPAVLIPARESISTAYTSCSAAQPSITAHGRYRAMADAPSWQPLPPRRRKRQKSDTTPSASAFEQKAKANADAVAANVAQRAAANARGRPEVAEATKKVMHGDYEHLDHTADIQFHAWGVDFEKALEALGCCLFDYVTEITSINETEEGTRTHEIEGADMKKFIFRFLDELLYAFTGDDIACRTVSVKVHQREPSFKATVRTTGEKFDLEKHPQGTEVKAITYSAMQIHEKPDRCDLYVIVDI